MTRLDPDSCDAKLVNCSLAGNESAFGLLVERHRAGVTRLLRAMFANMEGVEDLVQESFLQAYLDLDRLRDANRFGAWVRGIAVNLLMKEILAAGQMKLQEVAISRLHDEVFYGTLMVKMNDTDTETEIDCRPSDAINVALRVRAPITVAPEIMDQQGLTPEEDKDYSYLQHEEGERWVSLLQT